MGRTFYYSERCFVCGQSNPKGLQARFVGNGKTVAAVFTPPAQFQGFDGVLHGGVSSAVLDETLWYAVYEAGFVTVTVNLDITFRRSVTPGETMRAEGRFTGRDRRYLLAEGTLYNEAGQVVATANGRFMVAPRLEAHLGELIIAESVD